MKVFIDGAMVIARRDFMAIVGTPTFLIFLFTPLLMLVISGASGMGAASLAVRADNNVRIVAIAAGADAARLRVADGELRSLFAGGGAPPRLTVLMPQGEAARHAALILNDSAFQTSAVMFGSTARPTITFTSDGERTSKYLAELAARSEAARTASSTAASTAAMVAVKTAAVNVNTRQAMGVGGVFVIFLLTLLLAGQTVSMLAEEKSNKVIEILAAAMRLEAVFFGKLIGMFGVALVFITFWGGVIGALLMILTTSGMLAGYQPAVGLPLFLLLGFAYFTMAFMLLGGVFLGVGAQASTMREIQMMSLPITMFQIAMFGLSSAAAGTPGSIVATIAEWFPFSSPFAMAARAATDSSLWPHGLALLWQAMWVVITIGISARLFRAGVLKSGTSFAGVMGFKRQAKA